MNSHNSSTNAQKTVPPEYLPPMSLHRFCELTGLSKVSAWRYEKRGWLRTHLIANRRYILAADVADFNRRFALDEFAGKISSLSSARSTSSNETKYPTSLMLNGVGDTSGAILLFGVRPFAEKIPDEISILQTSCILDRGPPPPGVGVNVHWSKSNGAGDGRGEKPREPSNLASQRRFIP